MKKDIKKRKEKGKQRTKKFKTEDSHEKNPGGGRN